MEQCDKLTLKVKSQAREIVTLRKESHLQMDTREETADSKLTSDKIMQHGIDAIAISPRATVPSDEAFFSMFDFEILKDSGLGKNEYDGLLD